MSEHFFIDPATATPAPDIAQALAEVARQMSERDERIASLEQRLEDQEYSVRRVLEMLIEWLEEQPDPEV